jgi:hypothetical protein
MGATGEPTGRAREDRETTCPNCGGQGCAECERRGSVPMAGVERQQAVEALARWFADARIPASYRLAGRRALAELVLDSGVVVPAAALEVERGLREKAEQERDEARRTVGRLRSICNALTSVATRNVRGPADECS